jgi:hypothetical protein
LILARVRLFDDIEQHHADDVQVRLDGGILLDAMVVRTYIVPAAMSARGQVGLVGAWKVAA